MGSKINDLSALDSLSTGDLLPVWSTSNGDTRKAALSVLLTYIQDNLTQSGTFATQYSSPAASGFSVTIAPIVSGKNMYLLLTPLAGYAAGTIVLPEKSTLVDGQEVLVTSTQSVTTLTISLNGATAANGAPSTLAANGFFRLRYDKINTSWYRIG